MFSNENTENLFNAVLSLENKEECAAFFDDICTIKEIQDIAQRYEVARLLNQGMNYNEISAKTGASSATITRVSKCLNYGNGGYRIVLQRTEK
ncbi:MAG: hypothetical protein KBT46_06820 [Ruminococcus sp.]|nr:hypothetical protein [Candidatus Copronaster equi]